MNYSYSIEEDLSDIYTPESYWKIGKTDTLPPGTFSAFVDAGTDSGIDYHCVSDACVAHNPTVATVSYNYAFFPSGAVAVHPDNVGTMLYSGFRWQAPTNGICQLIAELYGITSYATTYTNVDVYLYH